MKKNACVFLLLIAGCTLSVVADAGDETFYCDSELVSEGLSKAQVLKKCGKPIQMASRVEHRLVKDAEVDEDDRLITPARFKNVKIDEWTVNPCKGCFKQLLHFEGNVLTRIVELDK